MILFILDTKRKKTIFIYFIVSIICIIINYVYSKFGHGVTSNYMTYMFLYPLIGGIIAILINRDNNRIFNNLYSYGIATLTVGSFIKGILEIAGTNSIYEIIFYIVGIILILLAIKQKFKIFLR